MHVIRDSAMHGTMAGHEPDKGMDSPWLDLAAAIVKAAADDYVGVLRKLWRKSTGPEDIRKKRILIVEKAELENFFHSAWYEILTDIPVSRLEVTDIDPDRLIYQCRITAREKEKAAIERANRKKIKELLREAE